MVRYRVGTLRRLIGWAAVLALGGASGRHTAEAQTLARTTASLEQSISIYVVVPQRAWNPDDSIRLQVVVSPVPSSAYTNRADRRGNWDRMRLAVASAPRGRRYEVEVALVDSTDGRTVWHGQMPIDPEPLAKASRAVVPQGPRISAFFDQPANLRAVVPPGAVRPGRYAIALGFFAPDGSRHRFSSSGTLGDDGWVIIRDAAADPTRGSIATHVTDAPTLLRHTTLVGVPGRKQFPKGDAADCQARSIWSLRTYHGRVYVGYGDWDQNRGPIDVWQFGPDTGTMSMGRLGRLTVGGLGDSHLSFVQEYTVQEESIDRFRIYDDRLLIPGIDGNKENTPDGLFFGNVYVREAGYWRKLSTVPTGPAPAHVDDVYADGTQLFVVGQLRSSLMRSNDAGITWTDAPGDGAEIVPFAAAGPGAVLSMTPSSVWLYRGDSARMIPLDLFPGYNAPFSPARSTAFLGGVVYETFHSWGRLREWRQPLFFLDDLTRGARGIDVFKDRVVRDLFVEGDSLFVLVANARNAPFAGEIYVTRDLQAWTRLAAFSLPATPSAFARMGGSFYVGLANRGYDSTTYDGATDPSYGYADRAAGEIWRVDY